MLPKQETEADSLSMETICHIAIFMASHFAIYFYDCLQTIEYQHEKAAWNLIQTALDAPQGSDFLRENLFWNGFALPDLVSIVYPAAYDTQPN